MHSDPLRRAACEIEPRAHAEGNAIRSPVVDSVTDLPFLGFVTVKTVPSGQVRAAAVLPLASNRSPLAVREPEE